MEKILIKTQTSSFENYFVFIQQFNIDINDFYSINISKYGTNFQGNYNSQLLKKLIENNFVFTICKVNGYIQTLHIFMEYEIKITLT